MKLCIMLLLLFQLKYQVPPYYVWDARVRSNRPIVKHLGRPTKQQIADLFKACSEIAERHQREITESRLWTSADGTRQKKWPLVDYSPRAITVAIQGEETSIPVKKFAYRDQYFIQRLVAQRALANTLRRGKVKISSQHSPYWYRKVSDRLAAVRAIWDEEQDLLKLPTQDPFELETAKPAFPAREMEE